jgi:hypothetical protein
VPLKAARNAAVQTERHTRHGTSIPVVRTRCQLYRRLFRYQRQDLRAGYLCSRRRKKCDCANGRHIRHGMSTPAAPHPPRLVRERVAKKKPSATATPRQDCSVHVPQARLIRHGRPLQVVPKLLSLVRERVAEKPSATATPRQDCSVHVPQASLIRHGRPLRVVPRRQLRVTSRNTPHHTAVQPGTRLVYVRQMRTVL